uniref:Uncharacterized protein n=1 Tax=Plectus sambesii TaxID=2011161 RepID=A0A914XNQ3_9BILA
MDESGMSRTPKLTRQNAIILPSDSQTQGFDDILSQIANYPDGQPLMPDLDEHWFLGNAPEIPVIQESVAVTTESQPQAKAGKSKATKRKATQTTGQEEKKMNDDAEKDAVSKKKPTFYPSVMFQPMLMTALLLCGKCSTQCRSGKPIEISDGSVSITFTMCPPCVSANTKIRFIHRKEILPRSKMSGAEKK